LQTDALKPFFYLLTYSNEIKTRDSLIASILVCSIAGIITELFRFLKQYISIKRRITGNSLESFSHNPIGNFESDENIKEEFQLFMSEKLAIILFYVLHRSMELLLAVQVMISYNFWIILSVSAGLALGNLFFGGITQDQVLISRIKRQIKMKVVLNQKINLHNQQIRGVVIRGDKTLIGNIQDDIMSLQKI